MWNQQQLIIISWLLQPYHPINPAWPNSAPFLEPIRSENCFAVPPKQIVNHDYNDWIILTFPMSIHFLIYILLQCRLLRKLIHGKPQIRKAGHSRIPSAPSACVSSLMQCHQPSSRAMRYKRRPKWGKVQGPFSTTPASATAVHIGILVEVLGTFMRFSWMFEDFGRTFWILTEFLRWILG